MHSHVLPAPDMFQGVWTTTQAAWHLAAAQRMHGLQRSTASSCTTACDKQQQDRQPAQVILTRKAAQLHHLLQRTCVYGANARLTTSQVIPASYDAMRAHTVVTLLVGLVSCFAQVDTLVYTETVMVDAQHFV